MNIAITGGTGFIGKNIVDFYLKKGHSVFVLSNDYMENKNKNLKLILGDISNYKTLEKFVYESSPDIFIHLAAQTQAYYSVENPYKTFNTNVVGTINTLEALRLYGKCKSILISSSDKTYGALSESEYTESSNLNGIYPYDASKSITDILARSYRETYSMPISVVRLCNVYGYEDKNTLRIIPGIIECYKNNKTFYIRNLGQDEREYIHVNDVVSAIDKVIDYSLSLNLFDTFNVSSGDRYKTIDLFNLINSFLDNKVNYVLVDNKNKEIPTQRINSDKLKNATGWKPNYLLSKSIKDIIYKYLYK